MGRFKKIYILAPAGGITGGPELLHQFGAVLRSLGQEAYINYFPFEVSQECPEPYKKYAVPVANIEDETGNAIIVPEVLTGLIKRFRQAHVMIWWLSVDNYAYQGSLGRFWFRRRVSELKQFLKGNRALRISSLKKYEHLTQSHYACEFLKRFEISSQMLSDFLNEEHFGSRQQIKLKQIAFNPVKGYQTTRRLIERNPDIKFVPIKGLTPAGVKSLLEASMIYIDFGHHPGKDRMPREAAVAGCCVITGIQGAAAYYEDIAIPDEYKLRETDPKFHEKFRACVLKTFENFDEASRQFDVYRERISSEKIVFESQVKNIFI